MASAQAAKTPRNRWFMLTLNNYDDAALKEIELLTTTQARYVGIGKEVGEQGTPHLHVLLYFHNKKSCKQVKKLLKCQPHIDVVKGTPDEARAYVSKDGDFNEFGEWPEQGKRTDLKELAASVLNGTSVDAIVVDNPLAYHQYGRTLSKLEEVKDREVVREEMTLGVWYYGDTGVGKTFKVYQSHERKSIYAHTTLDKGWWDNYDWRLHKVVLLDDFRGDIPYAELLRLVDRYPHRVSRRARAPSPFMAEVLYVTSSLPPEKVFHNLAETDSLAQLYRRFQVYEVTREEGNAECVRTRHYWEG